MGRAAHGRFRWLFLRTSTRPKEFSFRRNAKVAPKDTDREHIGISARRVFAAQVKSGARPGSPTKTPVTSMSTTETNLAGAPFVVAALYKFVDLHADELETVHRELETLCDANQIQGTLLLANEGLNGTVAGSKDAVDTLTVYLRNSPFFADIEIKLSSASTAPFNRLKVKRKKEIVTIGDSSVRPVERVGTYVDPKDWNALINQPDVIVIDTRNDYEYRVGRFEGAVNPDTTSFTEFPQYVKDNLNPDQHKRVAMYCTGGIRCEKSTSLLVEAGFEEVYHLHGGILKYLEHVAEGESLWQGECFVFDQRVSLKHDLEEGTHQLCFACRQPLSPEEIALDSYEAGVSCVHCIDTVTPERRDGLRERMRQIRQARERGEEHIGDESIPSQRTRKRRDKARDTNVR